MSRSPSWLARLARLATALTPGVSRPPSRATPQTYPPAARTPHEHEPSLPREVKQHTQEPITHTASSMARGLGLTLSPETRSVTRADHTLTLSQDVDLHDLSVEGRALIAAELIAARFFLDHRQVDWRPELERPDVPEAAYQKKDIPSSYGDRTPRLIPTHTRQRLEGLLHDEQLLHEPFDAHFDVIFVLEVGKYQHMMTHEAASAAHLETARIIDDARYTLFYQSYKIKPERRTHPWGKSRLYITREGLGAARALLLPDFDIQAAREQGFAAVASRDALLTVEPASPEDRDAARAWCTSHAHTLREQERYPYIMPVMTLTS